MTPHILPLRNVPAVRTALVALVLTGALLLALVAACSGVHKRHSMQTPTECAACHRSIAREWRSSPHAQAWTNPVFVEESKNHTRTECLPCHAPIPLFEQQADDPPRVRAHGRHTGVDCASCHRDGCALVGPYGARAPHATRHDGGVLRESGFCARCHLVEGREYTALYVPSVGEAQPRTCIDCHMPARVRRLTQGSPLSALHPRRVVRDHTLSAFLPSIIEGALVGTRPTLTLEEDGSAEVGLTLTNRGAGHRIPTGERGHRELRIRVLLLDKHGRSIAEADDSLMAEIQDGLAPGETRSFAFEIALDGVDTGSPVAIRLLVERVNSDETLRVVFLDRTWPLR